MLSALCVEEDRFGGRGRIWRGAENASVALMLALMLVLMEG